MIFTETHHRIVDFRWHLCKINTSDNRSKRSSITFMTMRHTFQSFLTSFKAEKWWLSYPSWADPHCHQHDHWKMCRTYTASSEYGMTARLRTIHLIVERKQISHGFRSAMSKTGATCRPCESTPINVEFWQSHLKKTSSKMWRKHTHWRKWVL